MFEEFQRKIEKAHKIAIFSHINTDADAIGSSVALKLALEQKNKKVGIFIQAPIPTNYNYLGVEKYVNCSNIKNFDLAIGLDCPETSRFGDNQKIFYKITDSIQIDHHLGNKNFAKLNMVNFGEKSNCATCYLLYILLKKLNYQITPQIATCLYSGIMSDTGRLLYEVNPAILEVLSQLIEYGADTETINFYLFQNKLKKEVESFKLGINNLEYFLDNKLSMVVLPFSVFDNTGITPLDTFSIVDYIKAIEGVEIGVLLSEYDKNSFIVSLRSKNISAENVAKVFGGGGHLHASGCRIFANMAKAKQKMIDAVKTELENERDN